MSLKFLTSKYPLEKQLFLVPRFALRIIGYYPETKQTTLLRAWAFLNFVILAYGCYAELYYGIYYLQYDVVMALDALCPVASSLMSLLKMFFIWWYRAEFKQLIEQVRYLTEAQKSDAKTQVKRNDFILATRLTFLVLFFACCTSTAFAIRPILNNVLRYISGEPILYETPFNMKFPPALLTMPLYPLTFLLVNWHGFITLLSFVGGDGFFLGFCLYFKTLLRALQLDLLEVLSEHEKPLSEADLCEQLAKLIDRHNEIADMVKKFSTIMVGITLGHFVTSSLIIGTGVVDMMLFSGVGVVVYVVYTCAVTTELFLYCLGGSSVIDSSEEVATIAYSSEWYLHGVRVRKMIWLIIVRAQRTFIVQVPFFAPSLPVFMAILRFAGSLIALVNSFI